MHEITLTSLFGVQLFMYLCSHIPVCPPGLKLNSFCELLLMTLSEESAIFKLKVV